MKVFKDVVTQSEVGSDIYLSRKQEEAGSEYENFLVLDGKYVEIRDEYADEAENKQCIDIIHAYNLVDITPEKKSVAKGLARNFIKKLLEVKEKDFKDTEELDAWKKKISADCMTICNNWEDLSWFIPSVSNNNNYGAGDGIVIFMRWNEDGLSGRLFYHKDAIIQESC